MDNSNTLGDWESDFKKDVLALEELMLLRTHDDNYASRDKLEPVFRDLSALLSQVEHTTDQLRRYLQAEKANMGHLRSIQSRVEAQTQHMELIREHMPSEIVASYSTPDSLDSVAKENDAGVENAPVNKEVPQPGSRSAVRETPGKGDDVRKGTRKVGGKGAAASTKKSQPNMKGKPVKSKKDSVAVPNDYGQKKDVLIAGISAEDLRAAPQYVRGRMTVDKIDAVAKRLSEIASTKYTLLRRPNNSLSSAEILQCQEFQEAQCEETRGAKFLTDGEIKGFGNYRIDSTVKSAINILRHFGRLKEVHGKNRARILIVVDAE